jgi:transposase
MLTQELLVEIHALHRQGRSICQIAKTLGVSRNTVRRYLRDVAKTPVYHRPKRISKLRPDKALLSGFHQGQRQCTSYKVRMYGCNLYLLKIID